MKCWLVTILTFLSILVWSSGARADTVHLKNGRAVQGIIIEESEERVVLNVGAGRTWFSWDQVEKVERGSPEENEEIMRGWARRRPAAEKKPVEVEKAPEEPISLMAELEKTSRLRSSDAERYIRRGGLRKEKRTEHFVFFYRRPEKLEYLLDRAEKVLREISADLGYTGWQDWQTPCEVYLAEDRDVRAWEKHFPEKAAVVHPWRREIFLSERIVGKDPILSYFRHELSHLLLDEQTYMWCGKFRKMPSWLNEGFATHVADKKHVGADLRRRLPRLKRMILKGEYLSFEGMIRERKHIADYPDSSLSYAQATLIVEYILDTYGIETFRELVRLLSSRVSFEEAMKKLHPDKFVDLDTFERKWLVYAKEKLGIVEW